MIGSTTAGETAIKQVVSCGVPHVLEGSYYGTT